MKKIDRLRQRLETMQAERGALLRKGRLIQAAEYNSIIEAIENKIKEAEAYEAQQLSKLVPEETLNKYRVPEMIIELHLAADYLADCAFSLRATLDHLGIERCSLYPLTDEICKKAQAFADIVCHPEFGQLADFMCDNEQYTKALHGFSQSYMRQHLAIKKQPTTPN